MTPAERDALMVKAAELETALDRFRAWLPKRDAEERALIERLQAHREQTRKGIQKADGLSAKLTGIRIRLADIVTRER